MTWRYAMEEDPTEDGFYVVWRHADEGEGYPPAEWDGVEEWSHGAWPHGDWGIVQWWDVPCKTAVEAEAISRCIPRPL
jgi:hypothetical protein